MDRFRAAAGAITTTTLCPAGHALTAFVTPSARFNCDGPCGRRNLVPGSSMYSCRACDFDLCALCAESGGIGGGDGADGNTTEPEEGEGADAGACACA